MGRPNKNAEFELWNWDQQDITLAERYGKTRERVRQIRKALNKPDPFNKQRVRRWIH